MKNILRKLFRKPGFSPLQLRLLAQIRDTVDVWVAAKGYVRPLHTVDEIAADIGLPPGQLNLYVQVRKRMSVLTWRKTLRIREAQRLLLGMPELPVSIIGEMVGIEDKSNFKRQFTQVSGMSPRAWRERHLH